MNKAIKSFCPQCLGVVEAKTVNRDGKIFIQQACPVCGESEVPHKWSNARYYNLLHKLCNSEKKNPRRYPVGVLINYNYDCNQRCNFCFAQANEREEKEVSLSEIIARVKKFKGLYVYLCGGEPTLRKDLFTVIKEIKKLGFKAVLLTNGKKLAELEYVKALEKAGLDIVQLQFDSFDDAHYEFIRNEKLLDLKLKVVENLKQTKIDIYLLNALIKGVNDNQIARLIRYTAKNCSSIKVLYIAPIWEEGRSREHATLTLEETINLIGKEFGISEDEFIEQIIFDYYSSAVWQLISRSAFSKFVPCTLNCYFFSMHNSVFPLSKIVDLPKVNRSLEAIYGALTRKGIFYKSRIFTNLFVLLKEFFINKNIRQFSIGFVSNLVLFYGLRILPFRKNNNVLPFKGGKYSFQIRIEAFFDHSNADFEMMDRCNLHAYFGEQLIPFCQQEIARKYKGNR